MEIRIPRVVVYWWSPLRCSVSNSNRHTRSVSASHLRRHVVEAGELGRHVEIGVGGDGDHEGGLVEGEVPLGAFHELPPSRQPVHPIDCIGRKGMAEISSPRSQSGSRFGSGKDPSSDPIATGGPLSGRRWQP